MPTRHMRNWPTIGAGGSQSLPSSDFTELGDDGREGRHPATLAEIASVADATVEDVREVIRHLSNQEDPSSRCPTTEWSMSPTKALFASG